MGAWWQAGDSLGGEVAVEERATRSVLDFNYFVAKIEPILATQGADGKACVFCHASHVIFRPHPPTSVFTNGVS
jgi:hypothetical protein